MPRNARFDCAALLLLFQTTPSPVLIHRSTRYCFWQQRLVASMVGTSAARVLRMIATDRMQAARIATGGKDAHVVPRVYGRVGYDVPVAQSATFRLKPYDTASDDDDASV